MAFQKVGSLSAIPSGSVTEMIAGDRPLAVCLVDGEVHAIEGTCPHRGGPLGYGALHGTTVVCPWHAWEFDCTTGRATFSDHLELAKFPVKIEGDDVLVDVD
jgi:nitrite reductase/ring-hydroxylating ferredoxin subunit